MVIDIISLYSTAISQNIYSLPKAHCHWLRSCYVAMGMVMVGYMCVQRFVVVDPTMTKWKE